ncbi:hypothetical protein [Psychroflexus lacisalsi]|jgi:hypothetical protein|uniref:Uncharacterized protein n=1 Tax=Psychroflexus lacisalsi TaxID=503928 RepID=A0ABP3V7R0_9FLAO|nr:hypothetical protein [Psychroflexus lacisalsi]MBZ9620968.1 hypothetical protein [Psychroflexus lacisalsi]
MFGVFGKKKKIEKINIKVLECMKLYSDETEKAYRNQISYFKQDYPNEEIQVSDYGAYKVRFMTNMMIVMGARFSKEKIGFSESKDFLRDIQIASAIAHIPFSDSKSNSYLSKNEISQKTEEIIKYILKTVNGNQQKIIDLNFNEKDDFFKKIKLFFHNSISESIENKEIARKILKSEDHYFSNLAKQNLKIMSDLMKI